MSAKGDPRKPPKTFEEAVERITTELRDLMVAKQRSYGKGNITIFGLKGVLVRASDKVQRLINLVWDRPDRADKAVDTETTEDTWKDLSGYGIVGLMVERGWWPLPLSEDVKQPGSPYSKDTGSNGDTPVM